MHVTSEEGEFSFIKLPPTRSTSSWTGTDSWSGLAGLESEAAGASGEVAANGGPATVCGVYFVADPDQIIEITMKQVNVDCHTGGLMAFVDGWELNGQYFPGEQDHEQRLERRIQEFCTEQTLPQWPAKAAASKAWVFRSSQNCALVQYRIPERGSFVISARFLHNSKRTFPGLVSSPSSVYSFFSCSMQHHGGRARPVLYAAQLWATEELHADGPVPGRRVSDCAGGGSGQQERPLCKYGARSQEEAALARHYQSQWLNRCARDSVNASGPTTSWRSVVRPGWIHTR